MTTQGEGTSVAAPEERTPIATEAAPQTTPQSGHFTTRDKVNSGVWSIAGFGGAQAIRFGSNIVMTRLLLPEDFGLMQIVMSLLIGLQLFTDIGIGYRIIQHEQGEDPRFRHTAWTLGVVRGALLTLIAVAIAGPITALYPPDDRLAPMIAVCSMTILLNSLVSTSIPIQRRRLNIRSIAIIDLTCQCLGVAATIAHAAVHPSPWSFVVGALVSSSTRVLLSHGMFPWREKFCWDRAVIRSLLTFGTWVFVSTALTFLAGQADRLVFGALIPFAQLGIYGLAFSAATIPTMMLYHVVSTVALPVFSRTVQSGVHLAPQFTRYRALIAALGGWMLSGLCAGAPPLVALLYPAIYSDAGWMLRILCAGLWFGSVLSAPRCVGHLANGLPRLQAATNACKLTAMVTLIPTGFHVAGFPGALVGYAASDLCRYGAAVWTSRRFGLYGLANDAVDTLRYAFAIASSIGIVALCERAAVHEVIQIGIVGTIVTAIWWTRLMPVAQLLLRHRKAA